MATRLLIVDDHANVRLMVKEYFTEQGFKVDTATNGREALSSARHQPPDIVLLDVMMPQMDGYDFIRHFRKEQQTPIILLTARLDETDKVVGLELGADDYVTKPFSPRELLARVRAVLRRANQEAPHVSQLLHVQNVLLDRSRFSVSVDSKPVDLTPTEFELLATLMSHPGRVFDRKQLLEKLHRFALEGIERTIDVHVRNLRAKLEPDPASPRYIQTVFGVGYRFSEG